MWESLTLTFSECSIKVGSRVGGAGAERHRQNREAGGGGFQFLPKNSMFFLRSDF